MDNKNERIKTNLKDLKQDGSESVTLIYSNVITSIFEIDVWRIGKEKIWGLKGNDIIYYDFNENSIILKGKNLGIRCHPLFDNKINIGGLPKDQLKKLLKDQNLNTDFSGWDKIIYYDPVEDENAIGIPLFETVGENGTPELNNTCNEYFMPKYPHVSDFTKQTWELYNMFGKTLSYAKFAIPQIEQIQTEFLESQIIVDSNSGEPITTKEDIVLADDDALKIFENLCRMEYQKKGIKIFRGFCPLDYAKNILSEVKILLAENLLYLLPENYTYPSGILSKPILDENGNQIEDELGLPLLVCDIFLNNAFAIMDINLAQELLSCNSFSVLTKKIDKQVSRAFTVNIPDYGDLIIPAGTKLQYYVYGKNTQKYLTDYSWIEKFYPRKTDILLDKVKRTMIEIPDEYLNYEYFLMYSYTDKNYKDIFKNQYGEYFCRYEIYNKNVCWATMTKAGEPDCPVSEKARLCIISFKGEEIVTEKNTKKGMDFYCIKNFPFFREWKNGYVAYKKYKDICKAIYPLNNA